MAKFVTGKELEETIYDIIWEAKKTLLIVSPYIKLDGYFQDLFEKHINNYNLNLVIIFGKNEDNISRSLNKKDFDFFKKFPNASVIYVPNLHAKYYGNEKKGVITSINLYDYSFKNNIEFGVYSENNILNKIKGSADLRAWDECWDIAMANELVFASRPVYKKGLLGSKIGKKYIKSRVVHDVTEKFYSSNFNSKNKYKTLMDIQLDVEIDFEERPFREPDKGYCIRTGVEIPFNPKRPFSYDAYKSWARYENPNYKENYCHLTGKPSNGKTSFNKPIL